jgi:hypothetical protein
MGVYTNIATEALKHRAGIKQYRPGAIPERSQGGENATQAPFLCPRCGDHYDFAGTCPRCDVALCDPAHAVLVPPPLGSSRAALSKSPTAAIVAILAGFGTPIAMLAALARIDRASADLNAAGLFAALLALVVAIFVLEWAWTRTKPRRELRRRRRAARKRAGRAPLLDHETLPAVAETPVRVRGRVRVVHDQNGEPQLAVLDGEQRVRVALDDVTAWANDDVRAAIEEGDEVEVIGRGRRKGAGNGYRDTAGEFTFEDAVDVELLARR